MVEYRFTYFRLLITVVLGALSVAAVGLIVALVGGTSYVPGPFAVVWLALLGWNVYWFGFRTAYSVQLQREQLTWRCLFRRGAVGYERIRAVRPMTMASNVAVVDIADRRPLLLFAAKGITQFGIDLHDLAPHISVRFGWQARLTERVGLRVMGWRRFDRRGAEGSDQK